MVINLIFASILAVITAYTDAKKMIIYNKHVYPFMIIGLLLAIIQRRYDLLFSALIVFGVYYAVYAGGKFLSRLNVALGGIALPENETAMGGGDLKLSVALALFIGHMPVLYGTILAAVLMLIFSGVKAWAVTGSPMAIAYVAGGKLPSKPVSFGVLLGPCAVAIAVLLLNGGWW